MATTCKLIAKTTLSSSAANIEFTSIPGTYTDLYLVTSLRTDLGPGDVFDPVLINFNGSSSNLSSRVLRSNGSTPSSFNPTTYVAAGLAVAAGATASTFGNSECYIPNYAGSTAKSVSASGVSENNATLAYIWAVAGLWNDTAAITSVKLAPLNTSNFVSGSSAFLYGITKSA